MKESGVGGKRERERDHSEQTTKTGISPSTLWPTKRYALACGLKCQTIRHESIAPVAADIHVCTLYCEVAVYINTGVTIVL